MSVVRVDSDSCESVRIPSIAVLPSTPTSDIGRRTIYFIHIRPYHK